MKIFYKIKIISLTLIVTSCTTVGGEFCINNGYKKKSDGYKQCTARYKANREFYEYCQNKVGITVEGNQLEQCLLDARSLKSKM